LTAGTVVELGLTESDLELLRSESGLRTDAKNPESTAFGIWQGLENTRRVYARKRQINPGTLSDREQVIMYLDYVRERYGTSQNALRFKKANGWY